MTSTFHGPEKFLTARLAHDYFRSSGQDDVQMHDSIANQAVEALKVALIP